jgi:hypothetical protein
VGDKIIVGRKPTGTLLIDYLLPGKNLYLLVHWHRHGAVPQRDSRPRHV